MSRDHDFGTGVCLWITDEDFDEIGCLLSIAYNELAMQHGGENLTERLQERRGVMTIRSFYSSILYIECNTKDCILEEDDWINLEHSCLATATNGEVFRDDLGEFTRFRNLLLCYYPDSIWRRRIANELHQFSAALQVNYARCMTRNDIVAAELCRAKGLESAMELYFLLNKKYAPYYKWTYRALSELDNEGEYTMLIKKLASTLSDDASWRFVTYNPRSINMKDKVIATAEEIAKALVILLRNNNLIEGNDAYLEIYINEILK